MDQSRKEEDSVRRRHSKEDKKKYRERRKKRKNATRAEVQETRPCKIKKAANAEKATLQLSSRAHAMVRMAVSKTAHRSTFFTPSLRSAILPRKSGSAAKHPPVCKVSELNRSLLSRPADKDIVLGEGTYGVTRLMHYNGSSVAVKESKRNDLYEVKKEAGVIAELQCQHHANLPFLFGICTKEKPYLIITQFYGEGSKSYSLSKAIKNVIIDMNDLGNIFKSIVSALQYVHEAGWLHNDIKENNVIMHKSSVAWKPVLIDFGKARPRGNPKRYNLTDNQKAYYKINYPWIAPEVIAGTHPQSQESDIFSLGMLLQSMLSKFVQRNFSMERLADKCTVLQPSLRISLEQLSCAL